MVPPWYIFLKKIQSNKTMVNQRISEHEYAIQNPIPFHLSNKYIKVPQHY